RQLGRVLAEQGGRVGQQVQRSGQLGLVLAEDVPAGGSETGDVHQQQIEVVLFVDDGVADVGGVADRGHQVGCGVGVDTGHIGGGLQVVLQLRQRRIHRHEVVVDLHECGTEIV